MKIRKSFSFEKSDPEKGIKVRIHKSYEGYLWPFFRASYWEKEEEFIGRWKNDDQGFVTIDEIEDLLHGRW